MPIKWKLAKIRELNKEIEKREKEVEIDLNATIYFGTKTEADKHDYELKRKEKELHILQKKLDGLLNQYAKYKGYQI